MYNKQCTIHGSALETWPKCMRRKEQMRERYWFRVFAWYVIGCICEWEIFFLKGKLQLHEWFWLLGNTPPIITDMRPINALRERESEPEHSVRNTLYYIYTIIHMQWWCAIQSIERNASPYVILNLVNGTFILFWSIYTYMRRTHILFAP